MCVCVHVYACACLFVCVGVCLCVSTRVWVYVCVKMLYNVNPKQPLIYQNSRRYIFLFSGGAIK